MGIFYILDKNANKWEVHYFEFATDRKSFAYRFYCTNLITGEFLEFVRYTVIYNGGYYCRYVNGRLEITSIKHFFPKWDLRTILSARPYTLVR